MTIENPRFQILSSGLWVKNSVVRIPFRYGSACLTRCPQAILRIDMQVDNATVSGFSGACLPPSWFAKTPEKSYQTQIGDMISVIDTACGLSEEIEANTFWPFWQEMYAEVMNEGLRRGLPDLVARFAVALVERAVIDGICRATGMSFFDAMKLNILGINPGDVHDVLANYQPGDWLPASQEKKIAVRHTIGLGDPLTKSELGDDDILGDGRPETLEEYLTQSNVRYLKVKVSNNLTTDLERLKKIAKLAEQAHGSEYSATLDGNEQYEDTAELAALFEGIRQEPDLSTFWENVLLVEQPFKRSVALSAEVCERLGELTNKKIIIDESDGRMESYAMASQLGYRGVSSKACKGAIKSILNAGLVFLQNMDVPNSAVMTGEDLCCVGMVSLQQDLALVGTLGLKHVEKNGHHYHPGLTYLGSQAKTAYDYHDDLYCKIDEVVSPRIEDGCFRMESLGCAGFGMERMHTLDGFVKSEQWEYESLGITE